MRDPYRHEKTGLAVDMKNNEERVKRKMEKKPEK